VTEPKIVPHSVTVSRTLAATPADLYSAWTEPERMRRWFATVVEADVRVGGRYRIEVHEDDGTVNGFTGRYLALEPARRVEFTFTHHSQTPADRISDEKVTVTFHEVDAERTEVRVTNSWVGPEVAASDYEKLREGWDVWVDLLAKHL
jgi:uncharacterized protein YndB with AHSA1/START domain